MNAPFRTPKPMTAAEFLAWEIRQEGKFEFVDRAPVAMAGGTVRHFQIIRNATVSLHAVLRGSSCQALPEGVKVFTAKGNYRYPDVLVDCGAPKPTDLSAQEPRVVFEVESPTTTFLEELERIEDYQSVASIAHIVIISQTAARGRVYSRAGEGWIHADAMGLEAVLELPALNCALPLAEIYEGVSFEDGR